MSGAALVTGASRGIGRAIALALARLGHPVAVNFVTHVDDAKRAVAEIEAEGGEAVAIQADVSESAAIDRCFKEVEEAFGPIEVLINNAGIRRDGLAVRMSDEVWNEVMRTNLFGPFACTRRALRSMIARRSGRVVNIASVAGLRGSPGQANYSSAKAGLIALTKTLAAEVAARGITVNAVAPGLIKTGLTTSLKERQFESLVGEIPQGRAGSPSDVAGLVAWLCSKEAAYVTGGLYVVDGGLTA